MRNFLRVLIISDLHFNGKENINVDSKSNLFKEIVDIAGIKPVTEFFNALRKVCIDNKSGNKNLPKAVIVAGDIVEKGGATKGEYEQAKNFLKDLAKKCEISDENIIIVPGNHDVNWDSNKTGDNKFENFINATNDFTAPEFINNNIQARKVNLKIIDGVNIELALFVSPTFSGYDDDSGTQILKEIAKKIETQFYESIDDKAKEDLLNHLFDEKQEKKQKLDIAVIGSNQRQFIHENFNKFDNSIKIAVLHHHLLPSSDIEVSSFESIIDSGKVLKDLVENKFDIAITGHKHHTDLVQYKVNNSYIDVFSSPSLFHPVRSAYDGFTILDLYNHDSSHFATITTYNLEGRKMTDRKLIKEESINLKTLEILSKIANWKDENFLFKNDLKGYFEDSLKHSLKLLKTMSEKKLIIPSPFNDNKWKDFITILNINLKQNELKSVSLGDLSYWAEAIENTLIGDFSNDSKEYSSALKSFNGIKERIWILERAQLQMSHKDYETIKKVVTFMREETGFNIYVCTIESVKEAIDREVTRQEFDFSIFGNICISRWPDSDNGKRVLEESFDSKDMNKCIKNWNLLKSKIYYTKQF